MKFYQIQHYLKLLIAAVIVLSLAANVSLATQSEESITATTGATAENIVNLTQESAEEDTQQDEIIVEEDEEDEEPDCD